MTASRLSRGFLLGAGLMAGSEMVNRAARIVTAIVLARTLEVTEFGVAAVVLTTWELVRMLTHNGLGARIVAARPDELAATCRHVHRLNWGVGITIFVVQCALAYPVAHAFDRPDVAPMLLALAATYLVYPFVMVRAFLAQRDPRLVFTAAAGSLQLVIDSLGSALLALAGAGVWSVVVPKLLIAPLWVVVHRAYAPAPPQERGRDDGARAILSFSARVFAAEALNTLRNNMDRIVVGRVLGLEALGTYSFAVNAGVGNTQSLATALGAAILPYLSAVGGDLRARFFASMAVTAAGIVPIVVLQAALAHWYVPLVFGERWAHAAPLLSVLCLSALARVVTAPVTHLLRSQGLAALEFRQSLLSAGLFVAALAVGLPFGLEGAAVAIVASALAPLPLFLHTALSVLQEAPPRAAAGGAAA